MKSKIAKLLLATLVISISGCAIHQNVKKVERFDSKEICVVENPAVKFDFLPTLTKSLEALSFTVKMLPPAAALRDCPVTVTYTANWRWDLAMYMAYAEIKVSKNGQPAGEAIYDSLRGGFNMGKFIKGETKIAELVNQLFPG